MSLPLPVGGFQLFTDKEVERFDVNEIADDGNWGYLVECDLEYCESLHEFHNDFPLASEHLIVTPDMLSPYCRALIGDGAGKHVEVQKLIPNLRSK
jgi:hypothetical protein